MKKWTKESKDIKREEFKQKHPNIQFVDPTDLQEGFNSTRVKKDNSNQQLSEEELAKELDKFALVTELRDSYAHLSRVPQMTQPDCVEHLLLTGSEYLAQKKEKQADNAFHQCLLLQCILDLGVEEFFRRIMAEDDTYRKFFNDNLSGMKARMRKRVANQPIEGEEDDEEVEGDAEEAFEDARAEVAEEEEDIF